MIKKLEGKRKKRIGVKSMKKSLIIFISVFTLLSCAPNNVNTANSNVKTEQLNTKMKLSGKVVFPSSFKTKATDTSNQILTISLLYPPEHPTKANTVAIAGVTNIDGTFTLTPNVDFDPTVNDVFILEAVKRDETTNNILTLRTYVRWLDPNWESMTKPNLVINTLTTAITIIQSNNATTLSSSDTIGKIDLTSGSPVISPIGTITNEVFSQVENVVIKSLNETLDPTSSIVYTPSTQLYDIRTNLITAKLNPDYNCGTCDKNDLIGIKYSGQDLTGQTLKNKNFSKSDLSYNDMKATNLSGSNFSEADLSGVYMTGANIENAILSKAKMDLADLGGVNGKNTNMTNIAGYLMNFDYSDFTGADFSNAKISSANFKGADVTNVKFTNADLSGASFENSIVSNTDFSGANMSGATWVDGSTINDGKICGNGSIGLCN